MTPSKISQKIAAGKIELVEQNIQRIRDLELHPREVFLDEEINAAAGESYLLRALIQGEKEIATGQGHTLTEVMADIDDFLALHPGFLDSIKEAEADIAAGRVVPAEEVFSSHTREKGSWPPSRHKNQKG